MKTSTLGPNVCALVSVHPKHASTPSLQIQKAPINTKRRESCTAHILAKEAPDSNPWPTTPGYSEPTVYSGQKNYNSEHFEKLSRYSVTNRVDVPPPSSAGNLANEELFIHHANLLKIEYTGTAGGAYADACKLAKMGSVRGIMHHNMDMYIVVLKGLLRFLLSEIGF